MKSMQAMREYLNKIHSMLDNIATNQYNEIEEAAKTVAHSLTQDGLLYITGSGHSHMIAEEIFYRAGGIASVYPILESSLMLHVGAERSSTIEKLEGYAPILLENVNISKKDVIIVISNSGRNAYPIEVVQYAQTQECPSIAITSINHSSQVRSRHSSNKKLYELADIVINNYGEYGDACISIPNIPYKMAPTSTISGTFIVQSIVLSAIEMLVEKNIQPDIFVSANIEDNEHEASEHMIQKWRKRIHFL